jgi:hypothetical protein
VSQADDEAEFDLIDEVNFITEFKVKLKGSQEKRWQDNLKGNKFMNASGQNMTVGSTIGGGIVSGFMGAGVAAVVTGAQQNINRQGEGIVLSGMEKIEKLESSKKSIKEKMEQMEEEYKDLSNTHIEVTSHPDFGQQKPGTNRNYTSDEILGKVKKAKREAINLRKKQVEAIDKSVEATKKAYTKGEEKK